MKRFLTICLIGIGLFYILVVGFASAVIGDCIGDQVLFKINAPSNAHGELWNGTNYVTKVCYDDIFISGYSGSAPHSCDGTNVALRLYALNNSHAELPYFLPKTYKDVCFGDLNCTSITSGNCTELDGGPSLGGKNWSRIISLSGETNAHVTFWDIYDYTICCKSNNGIDPICKEDGI